MGIEITRDAGPHILVVRNHSSDAIQFPMPGRRFSVDVPAECGLYCWMTEDDARVRRWTMFELKNPPMFAD